MFPEMELREAHRLARAGDTRHAGAIIVAHSRKLRRAADRICARYGFAPDETQREELLAEAVAGAFEALLGFRWFCPLCRRRKWIWGAERMALCWSADTEVELLEHGRLVHGLGEVEIAEYAPDALPGLSRRCYYASGLRVQQALKRRFRDARERLAGEDESLDRGDEGRFQAQLEARLDLARALADNGGTAGARVRKRIGKL